MRYLILALVLSFAMVLAICFPFITTEKLPNVNSPERVAERVERLEMKLYRLTSKKMNLTWVEHENGIAWGEWRTDA